MNLYLSDEEYRYDVEQTAIMLMPELSPRVVDSKDLLPDLSGDYGISKVVFTRSGVTASFTLCINGVVITETCRENKRDRTPDQFASSVRHAVRRSVYKSFTTLTGKHPAWGALSGVRPAKLALNLMNDGLNEEQTVNRLKNSYYLREDKARLAVAGASTAHQLIQNIDSEDISLYVGIPFCPTRCAYCSFISKTAPSASDELVEAYISSLCREISAAGQSVNSEKKVSSVYIGGGTPTFLSSNQLKKVMDTITSSFSFKDLKEFTVESGRPDTITEEKIKTIYECGGTRVSINPQTFSNRVLSSIGRSHTVEDVYKAFDIVKKYPLEINMDLIAGLPGDSVAGFASSVMSAISLEPENITVHTLSLKKGSSFAEKHQDQIHPEQIEAMLAASAELLRQAGYEPYYLYRQKYTGGSFENVGWSKPGKICRYNVYMMEELMPVLAFGAGAVTKLENRDSSKTMRITNPKYPSDYCEAIEKIVMKKSGKIF